MFRLVLAAATVALATAAHAEITFESNQGAVTIDSKPDSIAVYDFAAADTLQALGVTPAGAPAQLGLLPYLSQISENAADIGSLFEPDLEALNALAPDLTIVGVLSSEKLADVQRVGTAIDMTIWDDVVQQSYDRLTAYGMIFGKEAEAATLREELEADFAATKEFVADKGTALIVMTNGTEVNAFGPTGRFGWIHDSLSLPAASESIEDSTHGETVSFEFIRDTNPDILLVIDRLSAIGGEGEDAATVLDNALVHETKAWKNGNVVYLDSTATYLAAGGVQALHKVLASVRAGLE